MESIHSAPSLPTPDQFDYAMSTDSVHKGDSDISLHRNSVPPDTPETRNKSTGEEDSTCEEYFRDAVQLPEEDRILEAARQPMAIVQLPLCDTLHKRDTFEIEVLDSESYESSDTEEQSNASDSETHSQPDISTGSTQSESVPPNSTPHANVSDTTPVVVIDSDLDDNSLRILSPLRPSACITTEEKSVKGVVGKNGGNSNYILMLDIESSDSNASLTYDKYTGRSTGHSFLSHDLPNLQLWQENAHSDTETDESGSIISIADSLSPTEDYPINGCKLFSDSDVDVSAHGLTHIGETEYPMILDSCMDIDIIEVISKFITVSEEQSESVSDMTATETNEKEYVCNPSEHDNSSMDSQDVDEKL